MMLKSKGIQLVLAAVLGAIILLIPRPEGTRFRVTGDADRAVLRQVEAHFIEVAEQKPAPDRYVLEAKLPGSPEASAKFIEERAADAGIAGLDLTYVDGLSPKALRFLAILGVLIFLFIFEPIPLEITAILIGVSLALAGILDVKEAWAPYMHPVVVFIMCCLILAISLEKAGLTRRFGNFVARKAGTSVVRFTFILAVGLGLASTVMHDAAACAFGIAVMLPMMRAAGVKPHTNTARFMLISLAFACSCGGMGTLVGGGRCMVAAAFLKEFTGLEITFLDWIKYLMPAAILTVPTAVGVTYLIFRPDRSIQLPKYEEDLGPWSTLEKKTVVVIGAVFLAWMTKGLHGLDYSVTGMLGIALLVFVGVLKWEDIHANLEWGTALFIFGGGISLGLAMSGSGAAAYFAHLFFPLVQGGGWLLLFVGVGVFGALVTNAMANVAAAALILPIVIPMAQLEGVNPTVLALCLGSATSFAMLLVIGCPPNAIAYSYRYFRAADLTKVGAVATPVLLGILVLIAGVWWKILGLL